MLPTSHKSILTPWLNFLQDFQEIISEEKIDFFADRDLSLCASFKYRAIILAISTTVENKTRSLLNYKRKIRENDPTNKKLIGIFR